MSKTIALCIPAYNAAWCLPRLLQSALNQEIPFNEILVYNDCSTDETEFTALNYGAKVINGKTNQGCSIGKNELSKIATSTWLHFHDADDDLLPNFSTKAVNWIKSHGNDFDVLMLNYNYVDVENNVLLGTSTINKEELRADAIRYTILNKLVNFGIYKKSAFLKVGGFDIDRNVLFNEDNALHQKLAIVGLKFDFLENVTCINYKFDVSMSKSNGLKCAKANFHVLEKTSKSVGKQYPKEIVTQLYACIAALSIYQDWAYIKKALKLSKELGQPYSTSGNKLFNLLTRINPFAAVWLREKLIRVFKPQLRIV